MLLGQIRRQGAAVQAEVAQLSRYAADLVSAEQHAAQLLQRALRQENAKVCADFAQLQEHARALQAEKDAQALQAELFRDKISASTQQAF